MDKKIDTYLLLTTYDLRILRWRKKYKKVHTGCQKIPGKSHALTNLVQIRYNNLMYGLSKAEV